MPTADRNFQDWLDDDLWDEVVRDSEARLAAPADFAAEALERLFLHESDKERGFARWDEAMAEGLWWADDALACLRLVLAGAPLPEGATLGQWTQAHAGAVWGDTPEGPRTVALRSGRRLGVRVRLNDGGEPLAAHLDGGRGRCQLGELRRREADARGAEVLEEVLRPGRPGDGHDPLTLRQEPRQRDLRQGPPLRSAHCRKSSTSARLWRRFSGAKRVSVFRKSLSVLPGESLVLIFGPLTAPLFPGTETWQMRTAGVGGVLTTLGIQPTLTIQSVP